MTDTVFEWTAEGRRLTIRDLVSQADFRETEDLQREAWGFSDLDIVPGAQMIAAKWAGGAALGAFDGDRMIGFVYGFPAMEGGHLSMHSHMLAVRKDSRRLKAGIKLKLAQRERALAAGIKEISWTFDPFRSLNASLNFGRLGVISNRYLVDFYGEETSSPLHRGIGTDRLWVRWLIDSARVKTRLMEIEAGAGPSQSSLTEIKLSPELATELSGEDRPALLVGSGAKWKRTNDIDEALKSPETLIQIPLDIEHLKNKNINQASYWRECAQGWFIGAFAAGLTAVDFIRVNSDSAPAGLYRLTRT